MSLDKLSDIFMKCCCLQILKKEVLYKGLVHTVHHFLENMSGDQRGHVCRHDGYCPHYNCCGHQIGLIYFIQYFQLVFLWNAFGRPTGVFRGRFT